MTDRHKKGSCGSEQKGHAMTPLLSKPEYTFLQVLLKAVDADSKKKKMSEEGIASRHRSKQVQLTYELCI